MAGIHPGDLTGLKIQILGKLTAVDMTTAAVFNVFNNGPSQCLVTHYVLGNFSSFPIGITLPATWAFTVGIAPTTAAAPTAPTNLTGATTISAQKAPFLTAQSMANTSAIVPAFYTFYFAISTATNGLGTFDFAVMGGVLGK